MFVELYVRVRVGQHHGGQFLCIYLQSIGRGAMHDFDYFPEVQDISLDRSVANTNSCFCFS